MKKLILISILLLTFGCSKVVGERITHRFAGTIIEANEIQTTWNDKIRSEVTTTDGKYFVIGVVSYANGATVTVEGYENIRVRWLCIESVCYEISK